VDAALEDLLLELAGSEARHLTKEPIVSNIRPPVEYPHRWRRLVQLAVRRGQSCRVATRSALSSIRAELPDGCAVITSR
jgi:hypothetical protein